MKDLSLKFYRLFKLCLVKYWPIFVVLLVSLIFFYPFWLKGRIPLPLDALVGAHTPWIEVEWEGYPVGVPIKNLEITDAISQFYPWRSLVGEFWRKGEFPLWNNYMLSGIPFLATLHSAGLYPLNFIYLIFSDSTAWTLLLFFQIFLSGIFMFFFLRELRINKYAALFGGLVFSFSGYMIAWLEFATGGQAGLWLPLLLFFELKSINKRNVKYLCPISFIFLFIYTAGDFQVPFYITIIYISFGIYLISTQKAIRNKLFWFGSVVAGWIMGVLLSLPQLLPTLELYGNSIRQSDSYIKEYNFGLMSWSKVTNFLWPDFYGNVVTGNYWNNYSYHEYLAFTGIISIGFIIYSLLSRKKKSEKFFWIILVFSLLFLFPTPLAFLPYKLEIPGFGTSSASRIIFLIDFTIAVIAAFGFSKWIKSRNVKLKRIFFYLIVISAGVVLGLLISIFLMEQNSFGGKVDMLVNVKVSLRNMIPSSGILLLLFFILIISELSFIKKKKLFSKILNSLIIILTVSELIRFAWKNIPFSEKMFLFPSTRVIDYIKSQKQPFRIAGSGIPMNYFMKYGISSAEGYDPIYPVKNAEWLSIANFNDLKHPTGRYGELSKFTSSLIDYANVKYVIDYQKNPRNKIPSYEGVFSEGLKSDRFKEVLSEGRVKIFENMTVLPKVWVSSEYEVVKEKGALIDRINNLDFSEKKIILESDIELNSNKGDMVFNLSDFNQDLNKISFDSETSKDALLFLSESYNPDWKALVDGKETKIYRGNYLFQVIVLPVGGHRVEFIYYPKSFKIGKGIFIVTFLLLGITFIDWKKFKFHAK